MWCQKAFAKHILFPIAYKLSIDHQLVEALPIDTNGKYRYVLLDVHKEAGRRIVQ